MKKLITLLLVLTGMISTASAGDPVWTLRGGCNGWNAEANVFTAGSTSVELTKNQNFEFKVVKDDGTLTWYGQGPSSITVSSYNQTLSKGGDNISFTAGAAGTYYFYLDTSGSNPRLSVKYPDCVWKLMGKLSGAEGDLTELATFSDGTASVDMAENAMYDFKIKIDNGASLGNNGTMSYVNCSSWNFYSDHGNCKIKATDAGTYTFAINSSGVDPSVTVTYPTYETYTVYLYDDNLSWDAPYAYPLTFPRWSDSDNGGTGSQESCDGIAMTQVGTSNVWKADYRYAGSTYIAFVKTEQNNFDRFYENEAIYRGDLTKASKVYVPSTTYITKNSTNYYNDGAWHPFPTYTRSVTSGNFGTICLPFNATVDGATVFKIVSKTEDGDSKLTGINLESVDNLAAGETYIFKATGTTLTATMTGNYAAATDAHGMLGTFTATKAPVGSYVVGASDSKIHKVVSGGTGVNVGQYKGWITLTSIDVAKSRSANFLSFEDETTGIAGVEMNDDAEQKVVYNLNGQRVANPTKGLYIVNGKKVIMK